MNEPHLHIVRVDRRRVFESATLPAEALLQLQQAFRGTPWWSDGWGHRRFRAAARGVLHAHGSLALIGPGTALNVPPPFAEFFEPIEIAGQVFAERERLKTLSGPAPTWQEKSGRIVLVVLGAVVSLVLGFFVLMYLLGLLALQVIVIFVAGNLLIMGVVAGVILTLLSRTGRWFLVPGAIAIIRRPPRRGQPARVTVIPRTAACLVFRYVSTGKTVVLYAELWTHADRVVRRAVSDREAISILAAWQSPQTPPTDEQLQEVVA